MKLILLLAFFMTMLPLLSVQQDINNSGDKDMIIAIPASEENIDALMNQQFSRSLFFCLYNVKTDSYTFIENELKGASGGASQQVVQFLANNGVNEIYAVKVGQNAKRHLDRFNIRATLVAAGQTISQIINITIKEPTGK